MIMKRGFTYIIIKKISCLFLFMIPVILLVTSCFDDNFKDTINKESKSAAELNVQNQNETPEPGGVGIISITDITSTSLKLSWQPALDGDEKMPQDQLFYMVIQSTRNNIYSITDAEENGIVIMDWSADTVEFTVTGLTESTTYYFNVLVTDEDNLKAPYLTTFTATDDAEVCLGPVPGNDGFITITSITADSVSLSWEQAIDGDGVTAQSGLQYKILKSELNNIYTAAYAESNGDIEIDWTPGITEFTVTGLTESTLYYFNVIVKDRDELRAVYLASFAITDEILENQGPIPGNDGFITVLDVTTDSVSLSWMAATDSDSVTPQNQFEYKLVSSDSNDIYDVSLALINGETEMEWSPDTIEATVSSLTESTLYYFNVIVKDGDLNTAVYTSISVTTLNNSSTVVYMFNAGQHQGDMATDSARDDLDSICSSTKTDNYPALSCSDIRAFISISETDDIADMTSSPINVPSDCEIQGPTGTKIADTWSDLIDGDIDETLATAEIISDQWWSGSDSNGNLYTNGNDELNCGAWTSTSEKGTAGHHDVTDDKWLDENSPNCSASRYLLCICW